MEAEGEGVGGDMNPCLLVFLGIQGKNQCDGWWQETQDVTRHCGGWVGWVGCPFQMACLTP